MYVCMYVLYIYAYICRDHLNLTVYVFVYVVLIIFLHPSLFKNVCMYYFPSSQARASHMYKYTHVYTKVRINKIMRIAPVCIHRSAHCGQPCLGPFLSHSCLHRAYLDHYHSRNLTSTALRMTCPVCMYVCMCVYMYAYVCARTWITNIVAIWHQLRCEWLVLYVCMYV